MENDQVERSNELAQNCCRRTKAKLRKKFERVFEGIDNQGGVTFLNKIYTDLYITEGGGVEINTEHEVRQVETAFKRPATSGTAIQCNDIFKPLPEQEKPIKTVLTKGVAGIGKTVSVQKFALDWAEGKANQDIHFVFPLPFRELNLFKGLKCSLMDLLHRFFEEIKDLAVLTSCRHKVLFILDGLDECRLPLDFKNNDSCSDVTDSTSVDVLLTNLIKGNLLPSALLWITTRPAAASQIPLECFDRVTEVRGFNDPQKEEYFRKRISDQNVANRILTHIKSSRSLFIMCHIPVFCWISATVLERMLGEAESGEIPKTLTQMYIHFLIFQTKQRTQKYDRHDGMDPHWNKDSILSLGKLAFKQLRKGNLIFYEEDLRECGIDITEASVYCGLCTEIFREESGLHQVKLFCFLHLSIQEFLAALYVFLMFVNNNRIILDHHRNTKMSVPFKPLQMTDLLKCAVNNALASKNGHLDLFLRFLLGISEESNQTFLQGLLTQEQSDPQTREEMLHYIKKKIKDCPSPDRSINLFHCLNELHDHSLVEEVESFLSSENLNETELSPTHWSALAFILLTSEEDLDVFDLMKFLNPNVISDETVLRLLPVIKASKTAMLKFCNVSEKSCVGLASVLSSASSTLRELVLSSTKIRDSGLRHLCAGLNNPCCKLEILKLFDCEIKEEGCTALASALSSNPSLLRELDLTYNNPGDSGVKLISDVLPKPHCTLQTLNVSDCGITEDGCAILASALNLNPSHLRVLDLSFNNLGDSGVKELSTVLGNPQLKLETLRLNKCSLTKNSCPALVSVLSSDHSNLRVLDLSANALQDSGVKILSVGLWNPLSKLHMLRLTYCGVTKEGCTALASALSSNPSPLKELDIRGNKPGLPGVKQLSAVLHDPYSKLERLE
ncbi:protein NLRC3-like [Chanos chanos]|uniref:Protein NLRC3-like n=1 Tax=Chanos chanos TaxID=29144 RepID=A0A6J2WPV4_CHACN|nr:protein NLRC3-like [Chanos chanos]